MNGSGAEEVNAVLIWFAVITAGGFVSILTWSLMRILAQLELIDLHLKKRLDAVESDIGSLKLSMSTIKTKCEIYHGPDRRFPTESPIK